MLVYPVAIAVAVAAHGVAVTDVEIALVKGQTRGPPQVVYNDQSGIGDAVPISVGQSENLSSHDLRCGNDIFVVWGAKLARAVHLHIGYVQHAVRAKGHKARSRQAGREDARTHAGRHVQGQVVWHLTSVLGRHQDAHVLESQVLAWRHLEGPARIGRCVDGFGSGHHDHGAELPKPDAGIALACPPVFVVEKGSDALFVEVGDRNIEPHRHLTHIRIPELAGSHFEAGVGVDPPFDDIAAALSRLVLLTDYSLHISAARPALIIFHGDIAAARLA